LIFVDDPFFRIFVITMKRTVLILFLVWLPVLLAAQQIGQVQYGARVFSTGLPRYENDLPEDPPMMAKETREKALECIEWTFGKVLEYYEFYGECCGRHHFSAVLEGGDEIYFEEGRLAGYELVTPRFLVAPERMKGGLRVGRKPGPPVSEKIRNEPREYDPRMFSFEDGESEVIAVYEVDADGVVTCISVHYFEC
jgi:hypothetical protein